jgi:hypothetical protein
MTGHAPTFDLFGSYFPAWMVCIVVAIVLAVAVRQVLVALEIDAHLRPRGLVYVCLTFVFAVSIRLIYY